MRGTLVTAYLLRDSFTDRAQIISYLLLLLEIQLIEKFLNNKSKIAVVGLFLISIIIANVHTGAWYMQIILVLPYLGEYVFSLFAIDNVTRGSLKRTKKKLQKLKELDTDKDKIKKVEESIEFDENFLKNYKKREDSKITITKNDNSKYLFLIIIIIFIGGLFTPNASYTYTYLLKLFYGDTTNYIIEHNPIIIATSVEFLTFIIFTITCLAFIKSKMTLSEAFMLLGLYFMTIIGRRYLILLILLCSPTLIYMINDFIMQNLKREEDWEKKLAITEKFLFIFFVIIALRSRNK